MEAPPSHLRATQRVTPYRELDRQREAFFAQRQASIAREREGWTQSGAISVSLPSDRRASSSEFMPPIRVVVNPTSLQDVRRVIPRELMEHTYLHMDPQTRARYAMVDRAETPRLQTERSARKQRLYDHMLRYFDLFGKKGEFLRADFKIWVRENPKATLDTLKYGITRVMLDFLSYEELDIYLVYKPFPQLRFGVFRKPLLYVTLRLGTRYKHTLLGGTLKGSEDEPARWKWYVLLRELLISGASLLDLDPDLSEVDALHARYRLAGSGPPEPHH